MYKDWKDVHILDRKYIRGVYTATLSQQAYLSIFSTLVNHFHTKTHTHTDCSQTSGTRGLAANLVPSLFSSLPQRCHGNPTAQGLCTR